jgi:hypothetical protein
MRNVKAVSPISNGFNKQTKQQKDRNMKIQNISTESKLWRACQYGKRLAWSAPGKFLLAAALVTCLVTLPLLTSADQSGNDFRDTSNSLEGSWIYTVSPILPPGSPPISVRTYQTYIQGGTSIGSDRTKPFASPQHGTWIHLRGHEYANTFVQDLFDPAGTFLGTFKGRARLELVGQNELVGVANVEQRDPGGNLVLNRCARFSGVRIVVEPLAPPCDELEP